MHETAPLYLAGRMQWVIRAAMLALVVGTFALWASPAAIELGVARRVLPSGTSWITQQAQGLGLLVSLVPLTVALLTLWQADRLFELYKIGRGLAVEAAWRLRRIGQGVLLLGVLGPPGVAVLSLILTMAAPVGQRTVAIGFSAQDLALVVLGALLLATASVAEDAASLAEDHAAIV